MLRGLYSAASGMDVKQAKVESISNNLANATTPGYKKERVISQSFPEHLIFSQGGPKHKIGPMVQGRPKIVGTTGIGALVEETIINFSPGQVQETGNHTDIMINGPYFFAVSAPVPEDPGRVCYTRNGAFKVDWEGYLATTGGRRVLGEAGPVKVGEAGVNTPPKFVVTPDGVVMMEDAVTELGRLQLVEFDDVDVLRKETEGLFVETIPGSGRPVNAPDVRQGFLEKANVNVVDEMVDLIAAMRAYETGQRLIQSQDETLAKSVNQVGSLR